MIMIFLEPRDGSKTIDLHYVLEGCGDAVGQHRVGDEIGFTCSAEEELAETLRAQFGPQIHLKESAAVRPGDPPIYYLEVNMVVKRARHCIFERGALEPDANEIMQQVTMVPYEDLDEQILTVVSAYREKQKDEYYRALFNQDAARAHSDCEI